MPKPDISNWKAAYECFDMLASTQTPGSLYDQLVRGDEARYFAWTTAALTPWGQVADAAPSKPGKPTTPMVYLAAREGFKAPNKLSELLAAAHRHRPAILALKTIVDTKGEGLTERDRFGMAIREWDPKGGWRLQVLSALLLDVMQRTAGEAGEGMSPKRWVSFSSSSNETIDREKILGEWQRFLDHLVELDVAEAPSIKRLVDGHFLAEKLGVKPGKWMAPALDVVMAWQLRNPGNTDTAAVVEEVRKRKDELAIK